MAFNGSGTFNRLYSWVNDAASGIKIRADRMDNEMNGIAVGLSTCLTKDGQTTVTANLPMANFRHTGVGNAASRTDYASFGQVQDGKAAWADAGGTADAITANYSITVTALVDGQLCFVRASAANATTTPTLSVNGLTARTIVKNGGQPLVAGDIAGDGHELVLRYDLANTRWELLNPKQTVIGVITPAQGGTGVANNAAATVTSSGNFAYTRTLTGTTNVTFPTSGTLATRAGTETLSNKIVQTVASTTSAAGLNLPHGTAPTSPVNGDVWTTTSGMNARINGATQTVAFGSGITKGTTAQMDPLTTASVTTVAHGLSSTPNFYSAYLECKTAEHGWSIGDRIAFGGANDTPNTTGIRFGFDATNTTIVPYSVASISIVNKSTRASTTLTFANWKLVVIPMIV